MPPKTARDLKPLICASSFRRVTFDGRTHALRAVPTASGLKARPAAAPGRGAQGPK